MQMPRSGMKSLERPMGAMSRGPSCQSWWVQRCWRAGGVRLVWMNERVSGVFVFRNPIPETRNPSCNDALRPSSRSNLSIGKFFSRTQRMCFTAELQEDGLSDAPSVAVKELDLPALKRSLAGRR